MNGNNLQLFWEIASSNQDARLTSANQLVEELLSQQDVLASSSKITLDLPTTSEATEQDQSDSDDDPSSALAVDEQEAEAVEEALGNRTVADLMYALRRLLRGLASPRESSRLGFAVVLTELLSRINYAVTANEILTLVLKYSNPQVAASRQEQKDFMFAKLFGIMSLVQSELLVQPTATINDFKRSMRILIALSSDKPWMAESCAWVMVQAVAQLQRTDVKIDWAREAQSWMTEQISSTKELSPEKLAVMLQLSHGAGADFFQNVALPTMRKEHPLSTANLASLARVLKEAIPSESESAAPVGARSRWQAKIHLVWDLILDIFFDSASTAETRISSFPDLYRVVVDETLFAAASSHDRKSWGFQVFQRALPRANDTDKPMLFTPNFMRTLINQLGNRDRLLHRAAVKATETIQDVVKQQPHLGFVLVTQLIGKNGHQNFDSITKTKTVEHVLSSLDTDRVQEYVKHLGDIICQGIDTEDEDELTEITNRRKWALDQLLFLVRTPTVPKDDQLLVDILTFLAAHGYFTMQKPLKKRFLLERLPTPAFADSLKQVTRSRFLSSVSELAKQAPSSGAAGKKTPGIAQDGQLWLAKAHDVLQQLEKDKSFKSIFDHDDEIAAKLADGVRCLDKVRKFEAKSTDADVKERARAFQSLLLSALLVSADAADGASDLVEPLSACADKLFPASTAASARKAKQAAVDEEQVTGIELLSDCLLSFLELSSAFLRTSATNAFEAFSQDMTKESIGLLLSHLGTADASSAEQDQDEEMEDEEASDDEEDVKDGEPSDTSATSDDDDDPSDADADEDEDENEQVDEELRARVRAVLKESGMADPDDDAEYDEEDDDEVDDAQSDAGSESSVEFSDLGDDEMMLLDDKLAEVFRQRVSAARDQKEAKQEAIALRFKVLELVDIFARKQPQSPLMLDLILPLYELWSNRDEDTEQLAAKAKTLLLSRISKAKTVPDSFDAEQVTALLQRMHTEARESQSNEVSNVSQAINLYLTKVALSTTNDNVKAALNGKLIEIYRESLLDYLLRKASRMRHEFLIDSFRRFPLLGWELRSELLDNCRPGAATRAFRQVQVMSMLSAVLTQIAQRPEKGQVMTFVPEISNVFVSVVNGSCDAAATTTSNHMKDTIKFVLQAARVSARLEEGEKLQSAWKVGKLQDAADKLQASDKFKASTSIHDLMKQLVKVVQPQTAEKGGKKGKKRAAEGEEKVDGKGVSPSKKVKGAK